MATKMGTIKKTPIEDFQNVRKNGLIAIKLKENDSLEWVRQTSGNDEIMIITKEAKAIRFNEKDVRPMGRPSIGVRGIKLKGNDEVIEMDQIRLSNSAEMLVIMGNGLGKMTKVQTYRFQARGGSGVKTANLTEKTGKIVGAKVIEEDTDADLIIMSKSGHIIRLDVKNIPSQGRSTQGVYLMRMKPTDKVASISLIRKVKEEEFGMQENEPETETENQQPLLEQETSAK